MTIRPPKGRRPYEGTPVSVESSKAQITKLLKDYGADGVAWADNFQTGEVSLRFYVQRPDGKAVAFHVKPAPFMEPHSTYDALKGKHVTVDAPNWPRAMRMLHAWIKSKLEAVAFGLSEVEEEFLAQMVVRDRSGRESTAAELILPAIAAGNGQLALDAPAEKPRARVVEAEVVR